MAHKSSKPFKKTARASNSARGQALIEALLVLILLVAGFCFIFDFAYSKVAQLLLLNGSAREARAHAVGFNQFHSGKSLRVGILPVAGARITPTSASPGSEISLIRTYLQSESSGEALGILDYERWHTLSSSVTRKSDTLTVKATLPLPEQLPAKLGALFGIGERKTPYAVGAAWTIEDHSKLWLKDGTR